MVRLVLIVSLFLISNLSHVMAQQKTRAEHEHLAPHGGALIVLGEEFAHVELVVDLANGVVKAYILDREAEQGVPINQESLEVLVKIENKKDIVLSLKPVDNVLTGETKNNTSLFQGVSPDLVGQTTFIGQIKQINVKGQVFNEVDFYYPEGNEHNGHNEHNEHS